MKLKFCINASDEWLGLGEKDCLVCRGVEGVPGGEKYCLRVGDVD